MKPAQTEPNVEMGDFYDDDYDELEDDDDEDDDDENNSDGYKDADDNDSGNGESWRVFPAAQKVDDRPLFAFG